MLSLFVRTACHSGDPGGLGAVGEGVGGSIGERLAEVVGATCWDVIATAVLHSASCEACTCGAGPVERLNIRAAAGGCQLVGW